MSSPITQASQETPSALANLITQVSPDGRPNFVISPQKRPEKSPKSFAQSPPSVTTVLPGSSLQPNADSIPPSSNTTSDATSKRPSSQHTKESSSRRITSHFSLFSFISCCFGHSSSRDDANANDNGTALKILQPGKVNGNGMSGTDNKISSDSKVIISAADSVFAAGAPTDPSSTVGLNTDGRYNEISAHTCLLPPIIDIHKGRKCLVLDLDETLVHSSFKLIHQADFVVPVEIEQQIHNVYVIKRPGVDQFMQRMGEIYEIVVFTASLSKYANPVLDMLDIHHVVHHRLFRESCYNHNGNYVKDLSMLGRPLEEIIILDNSPASYLFHPTNAVPVSSWFNDPHDTELVDLCPFLAELSEHEVGDVRTVLDPALEDA